MDQASLRDRIVAASKQMTHFHQWWPDVVSGYTEALRSGAPEETKDRYRNLMDQARDDLAALVASIEQMAAEAPVAASAKLHLAATESTAGDKQRAIVALCEAAALLGEGVATSIVTNEQENNSKHTTSATSLFKTREETDALILTALLAHHQYVDNVAGNREPVVAASLATTAGVSPAAVSGYWKRKFRKGGSKGSYQTYQWACHNGNIEYVLYHLNGDAPALDVLQVMSRRESDED
jgi:hypothetical protein